MRVFSVEMLVKEEGAAVVEAALKRLKGEANAVAAQMKVTSSQVTTTGRAMQTAGEGTKIAGDRAAKAAIGFAAVGQSMARTGSLTADAGTRIIEAGSQIATMFGPTGLAVAALLSAGVAIAVQMRQTREEIEKTKKSFDELADVGNVKGIKEQLDRLVQGRPSQNYRDGIVALSTELAKLKAQYTGVVFGLDQLTASSRRSLLMNQDLSEQEKRDLIRIGQLNTEIANKNDLVARLQQLLPIATSVQAANTDTTDDATAALKAQNTELERAVELNTRVRGAIQEREAATRRAPSIISQTRFGTGLEAGAAERAGRPAASVIDVAAIERDILGATAEIAGIVAAADIDQQLLEAVRLDELKTTLGEGIAASIGGGFKSGFQAALASGNIKDAFKAMGQAIIQSMASTMIDVAVSALQLATLLKKIRDFMILNPQLAIITAVALISVAHKMGGKGRTADMGMTGGPTGVSYAPMGTGGMGATLPTQQIIFGATSATTAAGMQPRSATNVTIIGPNDPSAQRAVQELLTKANSRGRVG